VYRARIGEIEKRIERGPINCGKFTGVDQRIILKKISMNMGGVSELYSDISVSDIAAGFCEHAYESRGIYLLAGRLWLSQDRPYSTEITRTFYLQTRRVACLGGNKMHTTFRSEHQNVKRLLARPKHRWDYSIKQVLQNRKGQC
jgi:hypothetical protein